MLQQSAGDENDVILIGEEGPDDTRYPVSQHRSEVSCIVCICSQTQFINIMGAKCRNGSILEQCTPISKMASSEPSVYPTHPPRLVTPSTRRDWSHRPRCLPDGDKNKDLSLSLSLLLISSTLVNSCLLHPSLASPRLALSSCLFLSASLPFQFKFVTRLGIEPETNLKHRTQGTHANQYTTKTGTITNFRMFPISCKFNTGHYYTLTRLRSRSSGVKTFFRI